MYQIAGLLVAFLTLQLCAATPCYSEKYSLLAPSEQPPYLNCGKGGRLTHPTRLLGQPSIKKNQAECVKACKQPGIGCRSFGYSLGNNSCTLYSARLIDQGYVDRNENLGTRFYHRRCFTCDPLVCPNHEAIRNGGFEAEGSGGVTTPKFWNIHLGSDTTDGTKREITGGAFEGNAYLEVKLQQDTTFAAQKVDCVYPGQPYLFSAQFDGTTFVIIGDEEVQYDRICSSPCAGYQPVTATVTPKVASPTIKIGASNTDAYPKSVDNVALSRLTAAPTTSR